MKLNFLKTYKEMVYHFLLLYTYSETECIWTTRSFDWTVQNLDVGDRYLNRMSECRQGDLITKKLIGELRY